MTLTKRKKSTRHHDLEKISVRVVDEIKRAETIHPPEYATMHDGMSIIREEYLELEREVYKKKVDKKKVVMEAMHLAGTAMKLMWFMIYKYDG
jgi:hypothetical protein